MNLLAQYQAAVYMRFAQKGEVWRCGSITLAFFLMLRTNMDRLFDKKSKKSPKYSQRDIFPGILTNTAVGPLGFQTQLDITSKGEKIVPIRIWTLIRLIRPWCQMRGVAGVHRSYFGGRLTRVKGLLHRKLPPPVLWTSATLTTNTAHQVSVSDPCYLD